MGTGLGFSFPILGPELCNRGVPVGLFRPVPVFIVHKCWPVFRRRLTKGHILGRWQYWCISPTCPDTCISQALIQVNKDAACVAAGRGYSTVAVCGILEAAP